MNKAIIILTLMLVGTSSAFSQKLSLKSDIGVGTYYMYDLKDFQSTSKPDVGVDIKSTGNFLPYFGYCISLVDYFDSGFGLGVITDFYSTGSKNYYGDYSGYYRMEFITKSFNMGMVFDFESYSNKRNKVYVEVQTGMKYSTVDIKEELETTQTHLNETSQFINTSFFLKPGFRYEFALFKFLSAGAFLGCELNPKGVLHLKDNKDVHIVNSSGNNVKISWTGIRASLSISFNLDTKVVAAPVN